MNTTTHNIISPVNVEERKNLDIQAGDSVRVWQKIEEAGKTRLQPFEGIILAVKHGRSAGATFTVRRVVDGVGVEKIFPLYSPIIDRIEITRRAKVRRSKLYYIRDKAAREIRRQMRRMIDVDIATESEMAAEAKSEAEQSETVTAAEEVREEKEEIKKEEV